jgi:LysR family transcriptional regulator, transcriptional activator of the cysJI operon
VKPLGFSNEQVRTFVAVSKSANLSRAAESLALTQGAVTQQLRHLERALDLQLIERSGHGMRLTPAGIEVATACAAATRELEGIAETARLQRSLGMGRLRIGVSPTCANHYLPPLLARYLKHWPNVDIQVVGESTPVIAEKVAGAELDCGLVEGPVTQENLETLDLFRDFVVAVVSAKHPLGKSRSSKASELSAHRYLARELGSATETLAQEMLGQAYGASPRLELSHLDAVRSAAMAALGYAVLPRVAIERELERGQLVQLDIAEKKRWITAIRRRSSRVPVVEAFWTVLPKSQPGAK